VRRDPDGHQLVAVDGGLRGNPRPAKYGALYAAALLGHDTTRPTTVAGRHDEAGDVVVRDAPLPGDLLAVPATSCARLQLQPRATTPLVAVHDGRPRLLVRRETIDDILTRDQD